MPIETVTFVGAPRGMNRAVPPHQIPDDQARTLIDVLVDEEGFIRRRGPVRDHELYDPGYSPSDPLAGIIQTYNPQGYHRVATIVNDQTDDSTAIEFIEDLNNAAADGSFDLDLTVRIDNRAYPIVYTTPSIGGETIISVAKSWVFNSVQTYRMMFWNGGTDDVYSTGTITISRGSTDAVGVGTSWNADLHTGMYLLDASNRLVGMVERIAGATTLSLAEPALIGISGAAYKLVPIRALQARIVKGFVTCTTSDATVTGTDTKWIDDPAMIENNTHLYRLSTMEWIGQVATVTNNTSLELAANATMNLDLEEYVGISLVTNVYNAAFPTPFGRISAVYAGRQFYANEGITSEKEVDSYRVCFSDPRDPEAVDLSSDGDWFYLLNQSGINTPITAMASTQNALLIFKEAETFALYGQTPDQFTARQILDDGCPGPMALVPYREGHIWAGRKGVYYFDGTSITNLVEASLGKLYQDLTDYYTAQTIGMFGMVIKDHYLLHLTSMHTSLPDVKKGSTTISYDSLTFVINLLTGALTLFTPNVAFRGAIDVPAQEGATTVYIVNDSTPAGHICSGETLFDPSNGTATVDNILTDEPDAALGPDLYIETKRYDMGDPQRKKLWKQLQLNYIVTGDSLTMDSVVGLNETGVTSSSTWLTQSTFADKRIKFLKRDQYIGFRIYQTSSSVTDAKLANWAVGFKWMREGRV